MTWFVIISLGIYFGLSEGHKQYTLFNEKRKNSQLLHKRYGECFTFYNQLTAREKQRFISRVIALRENHELRVRQELVHNNDDVVLLIHGAIIQITFGYTDFEMESIKAIIVKPGYFYSKLLNNEVKGLTLGTGYIFYSWEDFVKGYMFEKDKINLALHELAHALYIDRFHNVYHDDWDAWRAHAQSELAVLQENSDQTFFRAYGKKNIHEFWAVCVECFFEDPVNFQKLHPQLYELTSKVLKQDMALRVSGQS